MRVQRLRVPDAGAARWEDGAADPITPARGQRRQRSGRPGGRPSEFILSQAPQPPAAWPRALSPRSATSPAAGCWCAAVAPATVWELPGGHVDPGETVRRRGPGVGRGVRHHRGSPAWSASTPTPGHVIAGPPRLAGAPHVHWVLPRVPARFSGALTCNGGVQTSDARWFTTGDIPALPDPPRPCACSIKPTRSPPAAPAPSANPRPSPRLAAQPRTTIGRGAMTQGRPPRDGLRPLGTHQPARTLRRRGAQNMSSPPAAEPAHRSPVSSPYDVSDVGGRLDPAVFDGGLERGVVAVVLVGLDQREAGEGLREVPQVLPRWPR